MRTLLFICALSTATAQTAIQKADKLEVAEVPDTEYKFLITSPSFAITNQLERELGGVTPTGKFYLVTWKNGKRIKEPCSHRTLIKAVEKANMDSFTKVLALRALGKPAGIVINAPEQKKKR